MILGVAAARPGLSSSQRNKGGGVVNGDLNWITNFIWGIADDVLRDLYVRGKYRDVILPMTVLRRGARRQQIGLQKHRPTKRRAASCPGTHPSAVRPVFRLIPADD